MTSQVFINGQMFTLGQRLAVVHRVRGAFEITLADAWFYQNGRSARREWFIRGRVESGLPAVVAGGRHHGIGDEITLAVHACESLAPSVGCEVQGAKDGAAGAAATDPAAPALAG